MTIRRLTDVPKTIVNRLKDKSNNDPESNGGKFIKKQFMAKIYLLEVVGMKVRGAGLSGLRIILERKRINCKIIETGAEIVSSSIFNFVLFWLKTYRHERYY